MPIGHIISFPSKLNLQVNHGFQMWLNPHIKHSIKFTSHINVLDLKRIAQYVDHIDTHMNFHGHLFITLAAFAGLFFSCRAQVNPGRTLITTWQDNKTAAISITYDDATINQFRQALPIMDTLGFKGTFFINTGDIPGSKFRPTFVGRPLKTIIQETVSIPTSEKNLFERASALRFLDIPNAVDLHNKAGSFFENGKTTEAIAVVDEGFSEVRKKESFREVKPVLLSGDVITWPEIKQFAARGHEFGNHTISHPRLAVLDDPNLLFELKKCKEEILQQLGPAHTFSAECPFGTENDRVMQYAYEIHPALRNRMPEPFLEELNRWSSKNPGSSSRDYVQWQRGPLQKTSMDLMKSWVDTLLIHNNIWLVLTFHGVDGIGWEAKPHEELREYFTYMKKHEADLWVATFQDVTKYIRQRMNSQIKVNAERDRFAITVTHSLDPSLYNFPLTLKTYIPKEWKKVYLKQANSNQELNATSDEHGNFILYRAIPNKEIILQAK